MVATLVPEALWRIWNTRKREQPDILRSFPQNVLTCYKLQLELEFESLHLQRSFIPTRVPYNQMWQLPAAKYIVVNPLLYFSLWAMSSLCESSAVYERTTNGISGDERLRTHRISNIAHMCRIPCCCVHTWLSGCVGRLLNRWPRSMAWRLRMLAIICELPDDIMQEICF